MGMACSLCRVWAGGGGGGGGGGGAVGDVHADLPDSHLAVTEHARGSRLLVLEMEKQLTVAICLD